MAGAVGKLGLLLALSFLLAVPAPAQETGQVTGAVVEAATGEPLEGAQVLVEGTELGTLTGPEGQYSIRGVPAGQQTVAVQLIGYGREARAISVPAGQSAAADFQLREEALELDQIVVTGTAGEEQRRAIGNVVSTLDADAVSEEAPVSNMQDLLGQRTPGMMQLPTAGQVGTGSPIRLRGISSMSLGNGPIVYVDGVRVDSDPRRGPNTRGGSRINRLNDFSPQDIESIEIIKGPSAATLYGTEASNGVIQIITKKGASGDPVINLRAELGTNWMQNPEGRTPPRYRLDSETGEIEGPFNIYERELERGNPPIFEHGTLGSGSVNVRGGTDTFGYFTSGSYRKETGVVGYDFHEQLNARGNIDVDITPEFNLTTHTAYIQTTTRLAQNTGGFGAEPFSNIIWSFPATYGTRQRGFMVAPPEEWEKVETISDTDRSTTSIQARFQPTDWLSHRLSLGLDVTNTENSNLWPRQPEGTAHLWGANALGVKDVERVNNNQWTVDYTGSGTWDVDQELSLTTSAGLQFVKRAEESNGSEATEFPAIPITTVSGGTERDAFESFTENKTLGAYVQERLAWRNRVFVTGAVRFDDNSAFGEEFSAATYPKASATWVLHEEPFFEVGWIDQLRLRSAFGAAGQQPGTFDAQRLFSPEIGFGDNPSLIPQSFGNPELSPERSEELEAGFDLSLLEGRVQMEFTHYRRWIDDAIVERPVAPSTGFSGVQIVNIGEVNGWGTEVGLDARMIEDSDFAWNVDLQVSQNSNEIQSLGDKEFVTAGTQQWNAVGYPIGSIFFRHILSAEIDDEGNVIEATCDGGTGPNGRIRGGSPVSCDGAPRLFADEANPTWQFGITNRFTLFDDFRVRARVEGNGGHMVFNSEMRAAHNIDITEDVLCRCKPMVQATRQFENNVMGMHRGGFLKLREVGASYTLPSSVAGVVGASGGSVSVAGRNLMMLWTDAHGFGTYRDGRVEALNGLGQQWSWDPELRSTQSVESDFQTVMPPIDRATLTVQLRF